MDYTELKYDVSWSLGGAIYELYEVINDLPVFLSSKRNVDRGR